jgi:hypothetical protein
MFVRIQDADRWGSGEVGVRFVRLSMVEFAVV